ncbi:MAG: FAD:protein FMN transferase [Alphaproteobacteria bacterium]
MPPEPPPLVTRRRFICVTAMFTAGSFMSSARGAALQPVAWHGRAMGADAAITLFHPQPEIAGALLLRCEALIGALETQLSLFQPESALCRLNRAGFLNAAPEALLDILRLASDIHLSTEGAFDVTVQPLWRLYAGHFAQARADPHGPSHADIAAARALVDARAIIIKNRKIDFARPGMAITLNGIAQGYITDQAALLLGAAGMENVLIDLGEFRALGPHPAGRPWRIGIRDPLHPWRLMDRVAIRQGAVATSGGYGTQFDASGRFHHLFDPANGLPAQHYQSLSVYGPDAARADALSTGLSILPLEKAKAVLSALGDGWGGYFVTRNGAVVRHNWPV